MATRRMFNTSFINSDQFQELDVASQCLYFALLSRADDDGFVESGKGLCRAWGLDDALLDKLVELGYLIRFDSILLIVHWPIHNKVPKDRYHASLHVEEAAQVIINQKGIYERLDGAENTVICSENTLYTQDSLEQNRKDQSMVNQSMQEQEAADGADEGQTRRYFWAAMHLIQINHRMLLGRGEVSNVDMDIERQLDPRMQITPQLNQLRWQLHAVSGRLLEGTATPTDRIQYKTLYGQIRKLAGRMEVP